MRVGSMNSWSAVALAVSPFGAAAAGRRRDFGNAYPQAQRVREVRYTRVKELRASDRSNLLRISVTYEKHPFLMSRGSVPEVPRVAFLMSRGSVPEVPSLRS